MLLIIGALVVFAAIVLLVLGLTSQAANPLAARMASLKGDEYVAAIGAPVMNQPLTFRVFGPLAESLARNLTSFLPTRMIKGLEFRLVQAGQPTTISGLLVATALCEATMLAF